MSVRMEENMSSPSLKLKMKFSQKCELQMANRMSPFEHHKCTIRKKEGLVPFNFIAKGDYWREIESILVMHFKCDQENKQHRWNNIEIHKYGKSNVLQISKTKESQFPYYFETVC